MQYSSYDHAVRLVVSAWSTSIITMIILSAGDAMMLVRSRCWVVLENMVESIRILIEIKR